MAYFPAGSKEDEIINQKLAQFGKILTTKEVEADIQEETKEETEKEEVLTASNMESKVDKNKIKHVLFKPRRKIFKKAIGFAIVLGLIVGGGVFYKTSNLFSKVSTSGGSIFGGLFKNVDDLEGMGDDRVNILFIGMRGQNIPGGSLLADSIMVISIKPDMNKVAMISIPRDLYVPIAGKNYSRKINEANPIGEEAGKGKGLELMKETVSSVTGLPIHYAVSANFDALEDTVEVLGGVTVHLDKPFYEGKQFVEGNECGGEFSLPAGDVALNGEKALCYTRARFATSDFDRARRQQEVLLAMKDKALSTDTLSDFNKINGLLNVVGSNIRTDMEPWEMQKLYEVFTKLENPEIKRKVFDTSKEGLLRSDNNGSYILLPQAGDFSQMHDVCQNIFNS